MRGAVARECIELLRLLCICPYATHISLSSSTSGAAGASMQSPLKPLQSPTKTTPLSPPPPTYPLSPAAVTLTSLNKPVGPMLEHLLTPSMVFVMMTDAPLFLIILTTPTPIHRPLAIWSPNMRLAALTTLADTTHILKRALCPAPLTTATAIPPPATPTHTHPTGAHTPTRAAHLHRHLLGECLVEHVYIHLLLPDSQQWSSLCRDDIGQRDLARFVEGLQSSLLSSKRVLQHIQTRAAGPAASPVPSSQLNALRGQVALKERVLRQLLNDHHELGYNDLNYDERDN